MLLGSPSTLLRGQSFNDRGHSRRWSAVSELVRDGRTLVPFFKVKQGICNNFRIVRESLLLPLVLHSAANDGDVPDPQLLPD